jgi:HTH-type transcriptional regulator/antitoxin HigA
MIMKRIRPIKTEADYKEALELLEELIDAEPAANTPEAEQLDILSSLIERYEENKYQIDAPNAIEAIKFVMEQRNLEPKDLIPFIGSKSRVSEVLSGKRSLSIEMIRSLESGLGIPSKVLLKKTEPLEDQLYGSWNVKVFDEMRKRGYFDDLKKNINDKSDLLKEFFESINRKSTVQALLRQASYRTSTTDHNALAAWSGFVIKKADKLTTPTRSDKIVDAEFMSKLAKLSADAQGPLKAADALLEVGIKLVIEPAFPKTYIDGATIFTEDNPIIGLTLRQDRLDNFWFTLMHEVAHIALHSDNDKIDVFYDEVYENENSVISDQELEADALAAESLIPAVSWEISPAHLVPSEITFNLLASNIGIHPCIVAGKYRHQAKEWRLFSDIINDNKVRHLFADKV